MLSLSKLLQRAETPHANLSVFCGRVLNKHFCNRVTFATWLAIGAKTLVTLPLGLFLAFALNVYGSALSVHGFASNMSG